MNWNSFHLHMNSIVSNCVKMVGQKDEKCVKDEKWLGVGVGGVSFQGWGNVCQWNHTEEVCVILFC